MNNILKYWPILTVVFASGMAHAWQEFQRHGLEQTIAQQQRATQDIAEIKTAIAAIKTQQQATTEVQRDIKGLMDKLLDLELNRSANTR